MQFNMQYDFDLPMKSMKMTNTSLTHDSLGWINDKMLRDSLVEVLLILN